MIFAILSKIQRCSSALAPSPPFLNNVLYLNLMLYMPLLYLFTTFIWFARILYEIKAVQQMIAIVILGFRTLFVA